MKKCKSCQKEIDEKAKKCPYCQTDLRNWFIRHPILTILLILVIIGIVGAASGGDKSGNTSKSTPNSESTAQEEKNHAIGETIQADKLEITVTSVEEKDSVGTQFLSEKPSEGGTLVAVDWKYKNVSDKPVKSFSQPSVKLVDSSGTEYEWDLGKSSNYATEKKLDSKVLSDLNPGISVTDAKVFEVSKEMYAKGGWKLKVTVDGTSYQIVL